MKERSHAKGVPERHLTDEQLLAFVDHAVSDADAVAMAAHVDRCPECRERFQRLEANLNWVLAIHEQSRPARAILENPPLSQFRRRLEDHVLRPAGPGGSFDGLQTFLSGARKLLRQRSAAVVSILRAAAVFVATTMSLLNPRASAETLLVRAASREEDLRPTSGTVLRSVVHVEVSSAGRKEPRELGTVTLVRDSVTPRIHLDVNLL